MVIKKKRNLTDHTAALFRQAISTPSNETSDSVDVFLNSFDSKISYFINDIAPLKQKAITNKQEAPWRNDLNVRQIKQECRKVGLQMA